LAQAILAQAMSAQAPDIGPALVWSIPFSL